MMNSKLKVLKCLMPNVGTTAESIANETGLGIRTVYRALEWANTEGKADLLNPNCKPHEWVLNHQDVDDKYGFGLAMAMMLIHTKNFASQQLPGTVFNSLIKERIYEKAESIIIKAKQRNPYQKEIHFEQVVCRESLSQLYTNSNIDTDVIETIKEAMYSDLELNLQLRGYPAPVFVKLEKLQLLDGKQLLKVNQLDYPKALKSLNVEDIVEASIVDYCPFHSSAQMRRVA